LPTIYEFAEFAEEGGFAAYGPRRGQFYGEIMPRQITEVFRGRKRLPTSPSNSRPKFELVINLKTAKAMGVTVPEALLVRADR
jgi:putative ABC transport system substrate-binding protein